MGMKDYKKMYTFELAIKSKFKVDYWYIIKQADFGI